MHDEIQHLLPEYHDGELDPERTREVRAHLDACSQCRQTLETWQSLREVVRMSADADCSSMFASELRESVMSEQDALGSWLAIELLARRTVAGLAIAVCLLTVFMWTESDDVQRNGATTLSIVDSDTTAAGLFLQSQELTKSDVLFATLAD